MKEIGIAGFGAYIPRRRLCREAIAEAHSWAIPGLKSLNKGVRSICGHDEDVITMAVAAARGSLQGSNGDGVSMLKLASTTLPFADRQNSTLVGEALGLDENLHTADVCGSQRAGTSALLEALHDGCGQRSLVVAAERRYSKPGSVQELTTGDGAAALLLDSENIIARFLGAHTVSRDLVDHYRGAGAEADYILEERWIRDEGYLKIVPDAISRLFEKTGVDPASVKHLVMPVVAARTSKSIVAHCGLTGAEVADNLQGRCGDTGTAHALLMLANTLEQASSGDKILLIGFGQGCDALLFEATDNISRSAQFQGVQAEIDRGSKESSYMRFLSYNGTVDMDWGIRAERDTRTALSAFYRNRETFTGFVGGRCAVCETVQFPKTKICVNPECNLSDTQTKEPFREKIGSIKSFTEDWLGHSISPPFMYGAVRFEGKASLMMEFADFDPGQIKVGDKVAMTFRIKDQDALRDFRRYFWKAVPVNSAAN